jgi:hypothetical protein
MKFKRSSIFRFDLHVTCGYIGLIWVKMKIAEKLLVQSDMTSLIKKKVCPLLTRTELSVVKHVLDL